MLARPAVSFIVCSHRPDNVRKLEENLRAACGGVTYETVVVRDARSLCAGYTAGLMGSLGDLVVFCHDDVEFVSIDSGATLVEELARVDVLGVAGTTRVVDGAWQTAGDPDCHGLVAYPGDGPAEFVVKVWGSAPLSVPAAQGLDGCVLACRRAVAEAVPFDAGTFDGFHLYDLDFSYRCHLAGYDVSICRRLPVIHASRGRHDAAWLHYKGRFEQKFDLVASPAARPIRTAQATVGRSSLREFCSSSNIDGILARLAGRG